jgi:hypothetical protein
LNFDPVSIFVVARVSTARGEGLANVMYHRYMGPRPLPA